MDGFTQVPDDGPARIVRFVKAASLPVNTMSVLMEGNILYVVEEHYETLNFELRSAVLKTRETLVTVASRPAFSLI